MGDAGKIGQAEQMRLTHPGNNPTQGASRTPPPTVVARHTLRDVMQVVCLPRASQMCAGCARGIAYVGWWTLPCAPWMTRVPLATLAIRANVAPAVTRPRRTEDGAPYGRLRNERCGI